jgi:phosphonate transport system permease protein
MPLSAAAPALPCPSRPGLARPPALVRRGAAAVALAAATEFKPWLLLAARALAASGRFLAGFWPPRGAVPALLARETWRTVAMATAGLALACCWRCR